MKIKAVRIGSVLNLIEDIHEADSVEVKGSHVILLKKIPSSNIHKLYKVLSLYNYLCIEVV